MRGSEKGEKGEAGGLMPLRAGAAAAIARVVWEGVLGVGCCERERVRVRVRVRVRGGVRSNNKSRAIESAADPAEVLALERGLSKADQSTTTSSCRKQFVSSLSDEYVCVFEGCMCMCLWARFPRYCIQPIQTPFHPDLLAMSQAARTTVQVQLP